MTYQYFYLLLMAVLMTLILLSTADESIGDTLITTEGGDGDALVLLSTTDVCIDLVFKNTEIT